MILMLHFAHNKFLSPFSFACSFRIQWLSVVYDMRCASCVCLVASTLNLCARSRLLSRRLVGEIRCTLRRDVMNFTNEIKTCNLLNTA